MTGVFPRSNFVVTVRFVTRPESAGRMRLITHDLTTASRAEQGCILYHFSEAADAEGVFFLFMVWKDDTSYRRYAASEYVRAFSSILSSGMLERPPVTEKWRSLG
jgi:quinol monooxygenase YgiN